MSDSRSKLIIFGALAAFAVLAAGGALLVLAPSGTAGDGPVPIVWDHEACAHCKMSIGEPHYAAQLRTAGGRVLDFDDPGCLMAYEKAEHPKVAAVYFHDSKGSDWIPASAVGFIEGGPTPMGYGLVAVWRRATPDAMTLAEARAHIARDAARHMPGKGHVMAGAGGR